ncbi:MAG: type II toxin-antitoxin system prevent-host-death family antitoxin [Dethiobacter sp.]|jgi:antitoxin YefM|nr:type II toxin-antitoxin system prevent-host-death family antitoxin [Dethiobacter sp.]MCL4462300.1 type II toxin-antitoxin system prevent-host-death family antitoxin [Bacillota bacterium]MCL5992953.1 type II toxin-antitoxin system prevent-host-death family antitoxin [Bacillota bacterium]
MLAVNYSTLREKLKEYCDVANQDFEVIIVTRKNAGNVVLMSEAKYNNLMENLYVRSNPEYYQKILSSIEELKAGNTIKADLSDE